jgi:hypothetical protein
MNRMWTRSVLNWFLPIASRYAIKYISILDYFEIILIALNSFFSTSRVTLKKAPGTGFGTAWSKVWWWVSRYKIYCLPSKRVCAFNQIQSEFIVSWLIFYIATRSPEWIGKYFYCLLTLTWQHWHGRFQR